MPELTEFPYDKVTLNGGEKFRRRYKRKKRTNVPRKILPVPKIFSKSEEGNWKALRTADEPPFGDVELEYTISFEIFMKVLSETNVSFNPLVLFRLLKKLYGSPDVLQELITKNGLVVPHGDWGYVLSISSRLFVEIRSERDNDEYMLKVWKIRDKSADENVSDSGPRMEMVSFIEHIQKLYNDNAHIVLVEKNELEKEDIKLGTDNIFLERMNSGMKLEAIAENIDNNEFERPIVITTKLSSPKGYIYLSSIVYYIIALESFINIIYFFLLKKEFRGQSYNSVDFRDKISTRDLQLRILTVHLFCDGFKGAIASSEEGIFSEIKKLIDFRNSLFHGTLVRPKGQHYMPEADHTLFHLYEGGFEFIYSPTQHYRGQEQEQDRFPISMRDIDAQLAEKVRTIIQRSVQAVKNAMNPQTRGWVDQWIDEPYIIDDPPSFE